jgi:hypothetical protein
VENSASFLTIKTLLQNRLVVMRFSEFAKMLNRFEIESLITAEENKALLKLAEHLKILDSTEAE